MLLSHDSSESASFQHVKTRCPGAVPLGAEISYSRIPFFSSQTRKAARINLLVRAIVPTPDS